MAGRWDNILKFLVQEKPQDFVSWLIEGGKWKKEVSPQLKARHINADILYQIEVDKFPCLLHVEFQRKSKSDIAGRLWEYNMLATREFSLPVYSFVVYLVKEGNIAIPPFVQAGLKGEAIHTFQFGVIKLWEIPTAQLKSLGFKGLLPLLLLTESGQDRALVEEIATNLSEKKSKENQELLALTYSIANLVFASADDKIWLKRRFRMLDDLLRDTWLFKELVEEGKQKGLEEGLEEGLRMSRGTILTLVEHQYPSLLSLTKTKVEGVSDLQKLQQLILRVSLADDEDKVRAALENED